MLTNRRSSSEAIVIDRRSEGVTWSIRRSADDVLDRLIAAEQDERRRLALFLHDGPVQQLSGIALMLDGALHSIADGHTEQAREIIETALARHRATIRELRDLSFVLEPVVLRDQGFVPALERLPTR